MRFPKKGKLFLLFFLKNADIFVQVKSIFFTKKIQTIDISKFVVSKKNAERAELCKEKKPNRTNSAKICFFSDPIGPWATSSRLGSPTPIAGRSGRGG